MTQKVALVTGASSGIGEAAVRSLLAAGYAVMAAGRNKARTQPLHELGDAVQTWLGDLSTAEACNELVAACISHFSRLDVLVNNAGIFTAANVEETTDENWLGTLTTNLSAPFYLSRAALPHLRASRGVILNIASDWGLVGGKRAVAYCASKGGMVLMTKAMALDHAHEGIRINAICPGDVETPMLYAEGATRGLSAELAVAEADAGSPTGRVTTADEVAALVVYLASDAARQITGAAIPIDGGNSA
jgi:NAD(P)-dependent dehydrogenase (short-subunit alcohol dehydrogenase family)